MVQGRAEIKDLLSAYGLQPQRSLGQNFLADPNLVDRIVRTAAVGAGDFVLEVGAGTGTLTKALADTGAHVVAYEIDRGLLTLLENVLDGTGVELRGEDVTRVDLADALGDHRWTMVANLPYNVGTPLVLEVLRKVPAVVRLVVMVQREVADRFLAGPGSRLYGLPSIVVALHSDAQLAFSVPREVFYPMPEVESAVVTMGRVAAPSGAEAAISLAAVAFRQRRKMLRRSLADITENLAGALEAAGVEGTSRPEDLEPADFLRIAEAMT